MNLRINHRFEELFGRGAAEVEIVGELRGLEFCEVAGWGVFERPVP